MKKLNLKLGSIKEMLSKEQMKMITGGYDDYGGGYGGSSCFIQCPNGTNVAGEKMVQYRYVEYGIRYVQTCCSIGASDYCCPAVQESQEA